MNNNRFEGNKIKQRDSNAVMYTLLNKEPFKCPCRIRFVWLIKNKRTDPDNTAYSKKSVLDGMVKAHILPDDTLKYITGFVDDFEISDKVGVRIEVEE